MSTALYEQFRAKGYALAGGICDFEQRACVYRHLYDDSGGRNVFPLIAAHGALWAAEYFAAGMRAARLCALPCLLIPGLRDRRIRALEHFADQFRDINRRVCAESYAIYHYTWEHGAGPAIRARIGHALADAICACHASRRSGTPFSASMREQLFEAFFRWEQQHIVAPSVARAFADFDWPLIRFLARRPRIAFAYFGPGHQLRFKDFASEQERIVRGLQAYRRAEQVGLDQVERSFRLYPALSASFHTHPRAMFEALASAHGVPLRPGRA